MRTIIVLLCLGGSLWGQELEPIEINFCDVWQYPERYAGQMVRFRTELHFERQFVMREGQCGPIPLAYPSSSDVKPKPSFTVGNEKAISSAPAVNFDKK